MRFLERAFDGKNEWWRYILVIMVSLILANIIGIMPFMLVLKYLGLDGVQSIPILISKGMDSNILLLLMMLPFVLGFFFIFIMAKLCHNRNPLDMINGGIPVRWKRIFISAGVLFVFMFLFLIISYSISPDNYVLQFDQKTFIPLLIIAIFIVPLQTSFEELLFRSYLSQGLVVATRNRLLAFIIPAILFALMHSFNPEVEKYGFLMLMPQYLLFGLIFGLVSVLDDGIEIAIGAHAMNNIFACLFVTTKASVLQTPAILEKINVNPKVELISMLIVSILFVGTLTLIYKWNYKLLFKSINAS